MMRLRLPGLRDRLLLLVLLATLPALALTLYTNLEERRLAATDVKSNALRLARVTARSHEQLVDDMRQLLVTLAELPEARPQTGPACSARFGALLKHYPLYANIGIAGPDGRIVCSATPLGQPTNASDLEWFERAVRTREFAVGEYQIDRSRGRTVLVGAYPVLYPGGGTQAVIFVALDLGWLNEFAGAVRLPDGWAITVSDESGTIVARHPDPASWMGRSLPEASVIRAVLATRGEGTAEVAGVDGVPRFVAFTPLRGPAPGRGAYVNVAIPRHAASGDADRILRRNLVGLGIVAVLAFLAAWVGSDLVILRRVNALLTATRSLSAGDLGARAEVGGGDEIGALAQAFNGMADRLSAMVENEQRAKRALAEQVNELVAQRTHEVTLLTQMSELLQACLTPEEAYAVIGQLIGQFFPQEDGAVLVIGPARDVVRPVAAWGASRGGERQVFAVDECWALRRGQVYSVDDCRSGLLCPHLQSPLPAAYLCVPLVAQGETLGMLHLSTGVIGAHPVPAPLGEAKKRLAATVAEQFALAFANLKLRGILRSQSIRDPLTGLFNRRYMEETLERELRRAERDGRPVGIMMLDIDRFKRFNDTYGHEAGDAVLEELGGLVQSSLRAGDVACRYGGEEFVLILPDASVGDVQKRADELREAVKRLPVSHRGQSLGAVRCSIGVSAFPTHGTRGETLLRAADAALYRAKHEGRDQVSIAG